MLKWIAILSLFIIDFLSNPQKAFSWLNDSEITFEAGYRKDDVRWRGKLDNSNSNPNAPLPFENIHHFKDIDIFQMGVTWKTSLGCHLYVRAASSLGLIVDGKFTQKYVFEDSVTIPNDLGFLINVELDPTLETTDIVGGKWVFDGDIALGYAFDLCNCSLTLAPVVGCSFDEQKLEIESTDTVAFFLFENTPVTGIKKKDCCDRKFTSRWYGPYAGIDLNYNPCDCLDLFAQVEYHWLHNSIKKQAHDNDHRNEFNSFHSISDHAHGWFLKIGAHYEWCECWTFGLNFSLRDFSAHKRRDHEIDTLFLTNLNGGGTFVEANQPEEIVTFTYDQISTKNRWRSYTVNAELIRRF